jgi:hypothetical protein
MLTGNHEEGSGVVRKASLRGKNISEVVVWQQVPTDSQGDHGIELHILPHYCTCRCGLL